MMDISSHGRRGNDRVSALERQVEAMAARLAMVPSVWAPASPVVPRRTLRIIGGQTILATPALLGIRCATTLTLSQAYNPDTDATYPDGLGRAWLYEDGILMGRVLVRHDVAAYGLPLLAGQPVSAGASVTLTYDPGGGGDKVEMTAWLVDWI